ncbi:MAG TPA: hypothetical protein VKC61_21070 [Pyrinomonadaceae bacterium]|nr:hypothetical protein [Pyrinomonadaceae bacterium]
MVKLSEIMILVLTVSTLLMFSACQGVSQSKKAKAGSAERNQTNAPSYEVYLPPTKLADLEDQAISESSGLVASRTSPGSYWTHNDAGNEPLIYSFDSQGRSRGVWRVTGATNYDWEDLSTGPGPKPGTNYLYIGDIGDNDGTRSEIVIYRIPEPVIPNGVPISTAQRPNATETAEAIRLRYPDGSHNSEALLVHPRTGRIYLIVKEKSAKPGIYAADAPTGSGEVVTLARIGEVDLSGRSEGLINGGAISPDGQRAALSDYTQGYEFVLPDANAPFDSIWKQPMRTVDLGKRKHGETICYRLDGKALLATSERLPAPLIEIVRR